MNKNNLNNEFKGDFFQLRKIINSWNLIPGAPSDEFDDLNFKILTQLYNNSDFKKLKRIVESELVVHYGLFSNEFNCDDFIIEIEAWWTKNNFYKPSKE